MTGPDACLAAPTEPIGRERPAPVLGGRTQRWALSGCRGPFCVGSGCTIAPAFVVAKHTGVLLQNFSPERIGFSRQPFPSPTREKSPCQYLVILIENLHALIGELALHCD